MAVTAVSGQSQVRKNNPYAPSPAGNIRQGPVATSKSALNEIASVRQSRAENTSEVQRPLFEPVVIQINKEPRVLAPAEIYRVGIDDVLAIKVQNAAKGAGYYIVRPDGTIDFPLAGENILVAGSTVDDIGAKLAESIKLFADPKVEVRVREYASHKVTVTGTVNNPGEKNLRREAVPLFVIKAEAMMDPSSNSVKVTGGTREIMKYDLSDPKTDNLLIYPGYALEFSRDKVPSASYSITGKRVTSGQRSLSLGLTLLQAVATEKASGGDPKFAIIRRNHTAGKPIELKFDLRSIRAGKIADPTIVAGDIIDIRP